MIKILHTADLHIGREYKRQEQENVEIAKRYQRARTEALENIVKLANEKNCDYLVIAGDLYDKKEIGLALQKEVCAILGQYEGTILVLPGNHDYYEGEGDKLWGRFLELSGENVILARENKKIEMGEICFYPCICNDRYSQENALGWLLEKAKVMEKTKSDFDNLSLTRNLEDVDSRKTKDKSLEKREQVDPIKIGIAHGAVEGLSYDKERKYYYMTKAELEQCQMDLWLIGHTHMPSPDKEEMSGEKILNAGTHQQTDIADNAKGSVFLIEIPVKEEKDLREKKEREKFFQKIHVRKIPTGVIYFEKREINLVHGESLRERIKEAVKDMKPENTTLRLILSGTAMEEEYDRKEDILREYEEKFLKLEVQDSKLQAEITRDKISKETLEGAIENQLLMKYLDEPEILNLAFELVKECKN